MNPGNVGHSFVIPRETKVIHYPIAKYALVEVASGMPNITLRRVTYDLNTLTSSVHSSGMPHSARWLRDFRILPL